MLPDVGTGGGRAVTGLAATVLLVAGACTGASRGGASGAAGGSRSAPAPARAKTTTTLPLRHFTLAAVGDILLHNAVIVNGRANAGGDGYDFNPMFDEVRDVISAADLAICHQETPISATDTNLTIPGTLSFNAPREIATALKNAGFDACDTASNHTWDRLARGVEETNEVLEQAGLGHSGGSRSEAEAENPPIYDVQGVKVGHLAYSYTIYNEARPSTSVPPEAPWLRSMLWPAMGTQGILDMARKLRARGAEFVVVSIHWGDQYVHQPNDQQRQLARDLLASPDIDLILGDHVHVVQPCENFDGKYVLYGMGNFLSNQSPAVDATLEPDNEDGTINTISVDEVTRGHFRMKLTFVPTRVVVANHRITKARPERFKASYDRTVASMGMLGAAACDATPAF